MPASFDPETISWQEAIKRLAELGDKEPAKTLLDAIIGNAVRYYPPRALLLETAYRRGCFDVNTGAWRNHARDDRPLYIRVIRIDFEAHFQSSDRSSRFVIGREAVNATTQGEGPRAKRNLAREALDGLFPKGIPEPSRLPNDQLCKMVIDRIEADLKQESLPKISISNDTILRAARRLK
jgi:hypothetical protein